MDALSFSGFILAGCFAVFSFLNRQRYKTLITDIYQPGNDELRSQLKTEREKNIDIEKDNARLAAENNILDRQNRRLPEFADLTKLMSNNHRQVMTELTGLADKLIERRDK